MLQDGQQLGEFEIITKLGHGGMGAVFKARQTVLRRLVAIKTLQPSLASNAEFVSRFHNEAVAAAGLNHPNLVQVYAAGQTDCIHWFAMEFVDGESVETRLKRLGKLDPAEAIAICMHVCTGLEYGWRKAQLIHRDIKPDNIFLSNDGEVKLGDLGLAKSSDQQQGLTMTGASMGTPLYISPEQAEAKRDIDLRTDIYSLGATLYHLLAGAPPYKADSAISVMMKHVGAPVPDIRQTDPSIPPALSDVIIRMMQKAPGDRHESYEELRTDLQNAYAALSEPSAAPAPHSGAPLTEAPGVSAERGFSKWAIPAVAASLLGLGAFALMNSKGPETGEKPSSPPLVSSPASPKKASEPDPAAVPPPAKAASTPSVQGSKPEIQSNADAPQELLRKLGAKLLPVPGTDVLMSKTEVTVGEWKAYLQSRKLPKWKAPSEFPQTDAHPVVEVSWGEAADFCRWLSSVSGTTWRMPSNMEWDAASPSLYPWGETLPPMWNDGNYALGVNSSYDSARTGADGIFGTAPAGSFKPNALGFYDLGGNAAEWVSDGSSDGKNPMLRGAGWMDPGPNVDNETLSSKFRRITSGGGASANRGFRVVRALSVTPGTAYSGGDPLAELVKRL
jgi:serine/threonine protein kinase